LRIGADGRLLQQIVPPDTISLDGVTDITVDESSGIALLVSHDTLYLLRLPAPPFTAEPVETPAPDPPQDTPETPVTE
jgi:hypothetical protein